VSHFDEGLLRADLDLLPPDVKGVLAVHGFDADSLIERYRRVQAGDVQNRVSGEVSAPTAEDLVSLPQPGSAEYKALHELGVEALRSGKCALAVLAGGMATRMGGVVKALVPAISDLTFLELRLREQAALAASFGVKPPLWLMTSQPTHDGIVTALGARLGGDVQVFRQGLNVRLTPEGRLFKDGQGRPSLYSPGHGDFLDALKKSGLLTQFLERGGEYVLVSNLDNLGGGLDPAMIGLHLAGEAAITCEVVRKRGSDRGGVPVRYDGRTVILEEFRLPTAFDATTIPVFNVNTLAFRAQALASGAFPWTYFEVKKDVEGRPAVQFERLIHELTFHLPTRYAIVERDGERSRFLPVKDMDELRARQDEIRAVAAARGMI
jgi:UTP--glucose-1-phosphate uridylyltransferase